MTALPSADDLEHAVRAALRAGDFEAVDTLLRALVAVDPRRGVDLYDALRVAVSLTGGRLAQQEQTP